MAYIDGEYFKLPNTPNGTRMNRGARLTAGGLAFQRAQPAGRSAAGRIARAKSLRLIR